MKNRLFQAWITCAVSLALLFGIPTAAHAATAGVSRDGMSASLWFTWVNAYKWNSGHLAVRDTKADGHGVHANILGTYDYKEGGPYRNGSGSGTTVNWYNLYYTSSNYKIVYVRLQGCVELSLYPDACTSGGKTYNPNA